MDTVNTYETLAAMFLDETGIIAPGKDVPVAMSDQPSQEERQSAWLAWLKKNRYEF